MSTTTIQERIEVDGVLTDPTSVVLRDPDDLYGVKRTDTDDVVVASGTALVQVSEGIFAYTFTDPEGGLTYNYWVEFVISGQTYRIEKSRSQVGFPDNSEETTGYLVTYDGHGTPEAGVTIFFRMTDPDGGEGPVDGTSYPKAAFSAVSDDGGVLQVALKRSASYQAKRERGKWGAAFTTEDDSTFAIPEVLGGPTE